MEEKSSEPSPNTKTKKNQVPFEFCVVCKLNHNQGRRHVYFPNHKKSLSSFFSKFQHKLSDVRFFLKNPCLMRPEHVSRSRLWCVFCDTDIDEVGSSFACGNAINHMAGEDHLKKLKNFLWKHGGGMDRVDSFRVLKADMAKWEKKCNAVKCVAAGEGSSGPLVGPTNNIHNKLDCEYVDNFEQNKIQFVSSSFSNGVMPLQAYTNERHPVYHSDLSRILEVGSLLHDTDKYHFGSKDLKDGQHAVFMAGGYHGNLGMYQAYQDERTVNGQITSHALQNLSQISSMTREDDKGNVHSGAPPPWFDAAEEYQLDVRPGQSDKVSPIDKMRKSSKLNPKRVGAAWAERRKVELAMENRGEPVSHKFDANWLPNFGRVWQSGSRKESRKEFEAESKKFHEVESQPDTPLQLQPYISKRQRKDAGE